MFNFDPSQLKLEYQLSLQNQSRSVDQMSPDQLKDFCKYLMFRDYLNRQLVSNMAKQDLGGLDVIFPQG